MTEIIKKSKLLRNVLIVDAVVAVIAAFALTLWAGELQKITNLPFSLIMFAGISFFPFAALLFYGLLQKTISKTFIWIIIGLNAIWGIDCFLLLLSGYVQPTQFGYGFVIVQAVSVFVYAALEFIGMTRSEVVVFQDSRETI